MRDRIVDCARGYLGTPFHHQGRLRGVGIDCVGVPIMVGRELGLTNFDTRDYAREPDPVMFRRLCREQLVEITQAQARSGDLVTFAFEVEQHIGILTSIEPLRVLHCYAKVGCVVEHELEAGWLGRVRGWWRFPGVGE